MQSPEGSDIDLDRMDAYELDDDEDDVDDEYGDGGGEDDDDSQPNNVFYYEDLKNSWCWYMNVATFSNGDISGLLVFATLQVCQLYMDVVRHIDLD